MDNVDVWNSAIEAYEKRLSAYYNCQSGTTSPILVEYHVRQIANDLRRENPYDKIQ